MESQITIDTFFNGRVKVNQSASGYRYSIDAVLLAAMPKPKPGQVVMDIGTGCGIIPIILAFRNPGIRLVGIELQGSLAKMAQDNIAANQMEDRVEIIEMDVRLLKNEHIGGPVDWIVSNPPYRSPNSGRLNPNSERALARHEIQLSLQELIGVCRSVLRTGGNFGTIYPCERLTDLFFHMRSAGIEPKQMRCVHSTPGEEAKLALVQGKMGAKPGLKVTPPLFIYGPDGRYTKSVEGMMEP